VVVDQEDCLRRRHFRDDAEAVSVKLPGVTAPMDAIRIASKT
jgi:hypothetical protein